MKISNFEATTIPDAWFQLVYSLMTNPENVYKIDKGSYVGQKRLEFSFVTIQINHPGARPLIPEIPPGITIPPPVESMEYVEKYFTDYLMDTTLAENETYKYSTWTAPGVERVINQLKDSPGNNQACISVGGWAPNDRFPYTGRPAIVCADGVVSKKDVEKLKEYFKSQEPLGGRVQILEGSGSPFVDTDNFIDPATNQRDPACLRVVDFRLDQDNTLHMFVYFRSWDLWGGFPANLAGLQLLKELVCISIGAEDGKIIASSKGLHLYDHSIKVAAERIGGGVTDVNEFLKLGKNDKLPWGGAMGEGPNDYRKDK
jgi:thymidylate synthase